jgi:hypothetical protein
LTLPDESATCRNVLPGNGFGLILKLGQAASGADFTGGYPVSDTFNPYREWLGLSGSPPANHYALLSLPVLESDQAKVAAACDRAITKVRSFRPGPNAKLWAQLLDEINRARTCLLDPARKAVYDAQLRGASAPALNEASLYAAPVPDFAAPTPLAADHLPMALPVAGRGEGFPPATPLTSHPAMAPYAAFRSSPGRADMPDRIRQGRWQ